KSNRVHTVPNTIQNTRTPGSSRASSSKTSLLSFLFLNLKIIFFHNQRFARVNGQSLHEQIVVTHGAHVPSEGKRLLCCLVQINFTFVEQFFFEREPVFLWHIGCLHQASHFTDLRRTTDHRDRLSVAPPINLVELLWSW